MQCERCKNAEATIHLTEIIKDVKSEVHLCEGCARDIGLNSKLSRFSLSIPEMLSFLDVDEIDDDANGAVCKSCGFTFMDYTREGKLGCPDCYRYLGDQLKTVILGFHGATKHVGKYPNNYMTFGEEGHIRSSRLNNVQKTIEELNVDLEKAVIEERYEEAAVIRDKIREIESG
jgi:protein arginine kinase activator